MGKAPILFLTQVEAWPFELLADVLSSLRNVINAGIEVRALVCGGFRRRAFDQFWSEKKDFHSAVLDESTFWLCSYDGKDACELLRGRISGISDDHLEVLGRFVESHTGLDHRFMEHLRHALEERPVPSGVPGMVDLERLLYRFADDGLLSEEVWDTLQGLSAQHLNVLESILRHQMLQLGEKSPINILCEELSIRGLLAPPEDLTGMVLWRPASPAIAAILRKQWCRRHMDARPFPPEEELIPLTLPVAAPAQDLVTRLENTLRNALVLLGRPNDGQHILALAPSIEGKQLYREATRLVDEDLRNPNSRLVSRQPTSFLTTRQLMAVFENGALYETYFSKLFPDKRQAMERLESFIDLRNAVAHNKVLSLRALTDLQSHLEFFESRLGMAAAETLEEDAREEVSIEECILQSQKGGSYSLRGKLSTSHRILDVDIQGRATALEGGPLLQTLPHRLEVKPHSPAFFNLPLPTRGLTPQDDGIEITILKAKSKGLRESSE